MAKCQICGKSPSFGRNIRNKHSKGWALRGHKTNRMFKPNIQKTTLTLDDVRLQIKLCTRCLRTMHKTT